MRAQATFDGPSPHKLRSSSKALRPMLGAVVDREDHDIGLLDGIRNDERRIRNDQLTRPRNPACSSRHRVDGKLLNAGDDLQGDPGGSSPAFNNLDRKSTRLNSSHLVISYAVFCLKKKKEYKH